MDFLKIKTLQEEEYFSDSSESSELDVSFLFETDGGLEFKISEPLPLTRALDAIITQQRSQLDISSDTEDSDYGDDTITTRKEALEPEDKQEENEYFEEYQETSNHDTFPSLSISRPILKAIAELGFVKPTNIQQQAIPIALQGRDICGSAVTGSGKTAAFMIPILERLLFRPRSISCIRVLIIVPTRELGAQCHEVAVNLGKYTSIESCLCVGGLSTKQQEAELKRKPDIVIATPGRLIDHIHNSPTFSLDDIEILVIDEADRILEVGFQDELKEIIKNTPVKRQTMLFSATMTTNIDELVQLSLKRPVKLFVDSSTSMTGKLVQEFVRIREHREETRPAILAALCARTYQSETLVFFKSKAAAHHMKIVFGLLGLKAAELHGNLTQQQVRKSNVAIGKFGIVQGEKSRLFVVY